MQDNIGLNASKVQPKYNSSIDLGYSKGQEQPEQQVIIETLHSEIKHSEIKITDTYSISQKNGSAVNTDYFSEALQFQRSDRSNQIFKKNIDEMEQIREQCNETPLSDGDFDEAIVSNINTIGNPLSYKMKTMTPKMGLTEKNQKFSQKPQLYKNIINLSKKQQQKTLQVERVHNQIFEDQKPNEDQLLPPQPVIKFSSLDSSEKSDTLKKLKSKSEQRKQQRSQSGHSYQPKMKQFQFVKDLQALRFDTQDCENDDGQVVKNNLIMQKKQIDETQESASVVQFNALIPFQEKRRSESQSVSELNISSALNNQAILKQNKIPKINQNNPTKLNKSNSSKQSKESRSCRRPSQSKESSQSKSSSTKKRKSHQLFVPFKMKKVQNVNSVATKQQGVTNRRKKPKIFNVELDQIEFKTPMTSGTSKKNLMKVNNNTLNISKSQQKLKLQQYSTKSQEKLKSLANVRSKSIGKKHTKKYIESLKQTKTQYNYEIELSNQSRSVSKGKKSADDKSESVRSIYSVQLPRQSKQKSYMTQIETRSIISKQSRFDQNFKSLEEQDQINQQTGRFGNNKYSFQTIDQTNSNMQFKSYWHTKTPRSKRGQFSESVLSLTSSRKTKITKKFVQPYDTQDIYIKNQTDKNLCSKGSFKLEKRIVSPKQKREAFSSMIQSKQQKMRPYDKKITELNKKKAKLNQSQTSQQAFLEIPKEFQSSLTNGSRTHKNSLVKFVQYNRNTNCLVNGEESIKSNNYDISTNNNQRGTFQLKNVHDKVLTDRKNSMERITPQSQAKYSVRSKNGSKMSSTVKSYKLKQKDYKEMFAQRQFQLEDTNNNQKVQKWKQQSHIETQRNQDIIFSLNYNNSMEIEQASEILSSRASNACKSVKKGTVPATANQTPVTMISDINSKQVSSRLLSPKGHGLQSKQFKSTILNAKKFQNLSGMKQQSVMVQPKRKNLTNQSLRDSFKQAPAKTTKLMLKSPIPNQ